MISEVAVGSIPNPSHRDAPGPEHHSSHHWRTSPVPAALLLAVIPLVLFGGPAAVSRPTAPVPVKPVATESVTARRSDVGTFHARWRPMYDVPPATVIHEVIHELKGGDAPQEFTGKPVEAVARPLPPARLVRRAALRPTDVCAKHGQRKVTYTVRGYQHWRCRR